MCVKWNTISAVTWRTGHEHIIADAFRSKKSYFTSVVTTMCKYIYNIYIYIYIYIYIFIFYLFIYLYIYIYIWEIRKYMQGPIQSLRCTYLYLYHSDFSYIKNKRKYAN